MSSLPRIRNLNPLRLVRDNFSYVSLPNSESSRNGSPTSYYGRKWPLSDRVRFGRISITRAIASAIAVIVVVALVVGGVRKHHQDKKIDEPTPFFWQVYDRLDGYYNGIRTLVPHGEHEVENRYNQSHPPVLEKKANLPREPPLDPIKYSPYPDYNSQEYLKDHHRVKECFLDVEEKIATPEIYAYPGVPKVYPEPFFGSYGELGMQDHMCFERFGRLGPYGYGYNESHPGALGPGTKSEKAGSEKVFQQAGFIDYTKIDWGSAQERCREKNKARFEQSGIRGRKPVKRHAYVLRTWAGFDYNDHQIYSLRAMINELSLKSGGEYDVHFLVHIKNNSIPIWADKDLYRKTLEENVPREFWNLATLWSEQQMMMYYPDPFPDNFANMAGSGIHGVYRSAHFPLQWFSQQHPEYDFVWNWEMDIRYTGHYYEFNSRIGEWAKQQPRKGLWERSSRFYIPKHHGDYRNFTSYVEREIQEKDIPANDLQKNGPVPIWGPVQDFPNRGMLSSPEGTTPPTSYDQDKYEWGVGEDADLLTFNPIFDPSKTNWVFSWDVTGYNRTMPIPPRRAAIITVGRLSKRLLNTMHEETWKMKHTMFPEMWPPAAAMHHGLKAAYVPHPVYFDRDWDVNYMNEIFNHPAAEWASPFGWGEHNLLGSSFYYNAGFSGALWRRWLGQRENGEGGRKEEEEGTGRLCLRPVLHHPIKHEMGPSE